MESLQKLDDGNLAMDMPPGPVFRCFLSISLLIPTAYLLFYRTKIPID
jgi:hypothetical protein